MSGTVWKTRASPCNCWNAVRSTAANRGWISCSRPLCCATPSTTTGIRASPLLLTGDGSGFADGVGFHADLERMHRRGWRIEVLSWRHSCNRRMREWAEQNGSFVALDDFYDAITFLEPPLPGEPVAALRHAIAVDLRRRM